MIPALGCLRRAYSGLVFMYEARLKPNPILFSKECAKSMGRTFRSSTEINFRSRFSVFSLNPRKPQITLLIILTLKANSTATSNYRGVEESGATPAKQQTGQVRLPGVTGNTPAPTAAVKYYSAALASASANVIGGQGTLPSSSQAMAVTTSNFVCEAACIAQEYVEQNAEVEVLQLHYVGGMKSTGSTVRGCNAVHLTWLLVVCVRCEAAVCCHIYSCTSRI